MVHHTMHDAEGIFDDNRQNFEMDDEENSDRFAENEQPGVATNAAKREVNKVSLSGLAAVLPAIGRIYDAHADATNTQEDSGQGRVTHDDEGGRGVSEIADDIPSPLITIAGEIVEVKDNVERGVVYSREEHDEDTHLRLKRGRDAISIVCLVFVVVSIGVVCIVTTNIQRIPNPGEKARNEDANEPSGTIDLIDAISMRGNGFFPTPTPSRFTVADLGFAHITPQPTLERPLLERVALKPRPGATQPLLLACQGECSSDADCRGGSLRDCELRRLFFIQTLKSNPLRRGTDLLPSSEGGASSELPR